MTRRAVFLHFFFDVLVGRLEGSFLSHVPFDHSESFITLSYMILDSVAVMIETYWRVSLKFISCSQFVMALSNPLHGERRAGFVGKPLPGVQVRGLYSATLERIFSIYILYILDDYI